jgi:hypothetical protein
VSEDADAAAATPSAQVATAPATAPPPTSPRSKDGVTLGDTKVIGCHDPGPKRTPASECDHLAGFDTAFAHAILDNAACLPQGTAAGAITYVADVSYGRHHNPVRVTYTRDATSVPSKAASTCATAVKKALGAVALDANHGHARYEIEIAASYSATPK